VPRFEVRERPRVIFARFASWSRDEERESRAPSPRTRPLCPPGCIVSGIPSCAVRAASRRSRHHRHHVLRAPSWTAARLNLSKCARRYSAIAVESVLSLQVGNSLVSRIRDPRHWALLPRCSGQPSLVSRRAPGREMRGIRPLPTEQRVDRPRRLTPVRQPEAPGSWQSSEASELWKDVPGPVARFGAWRNEVCTLQVRPCDRSACVTFAGHVVVVAASPSPRTVIVDDCRACTAPRRSMSRHAADAHPVEACGPPVGFAVGVPADQGESVGGDVLGHADDADISRGSAPDPARHWPERTRAAASGTTR